MSAFYRISPEAVAFASATDKAAALEAVCRALCAAEARLDADELLESLEEREALGSTGFGRGVAMPHARSDRVNRPVACMIRLDEPIDFAATDALPVSLVFGLVSPIDAGVTHLHALAALSRLVRDEETLGSLMSAPDADALFALVSQVSERDVA